MLLECGADTNVVNGGGNTALHLAVLNGHEAVVSALATHPSCDIGVLDSNGQNALHLSAVVGELGCMQVIVLAGQQGVVKEEMAVVAAATPVLAPTPAQAPAPAPAPVPAKKASPWIPCTTESGSVYYYNTETGDSSWDNPFQNTPPPTSTTPEPAALTEVNQQEEVRLGEDDRK